MVLWSVLLFQSTFVNESTLEHVSNHPPSPENRLIKIGSGKGFSAASLNTDRLAFSTLTPLTLPCVHKRHSFVLIGKKMPLSNGYPAAPAGVVACP